MLAVFQCFSAVLPALFPDWREKKYFWRNDSRFSRSLLFFWANFYREFNEICLLLNFVSLFCVHLSLQFAPCYWRCSRHVRVVRVTGRNSNMLHNVISLMHHVKLQRGPRALFRSDWSRNFNKNFQEILQKSKETHLLKGFATLFKVNSDWWFLEIEMKARSFTAKTKRKGGSSILIKNSRTAANSDS